MKKQISAKVRGFICTTSHPVGCEKHVKEQIDYVKSLKKTSFNPKKVLVIGASTGYGLASRIMASFGCDAQTIGVFFERESTGIKTASAGWYNTAAFEKFANENNIYAKSINGDAFSDEIKQKTVDLIKKDWNGEVDLVIYSLAAPRRTISKTGETFNSVLKPTGKSYKDKTVNVISGEVSDITIEPANEAEIIATEKVMGGEDWQDWISVLSKENLLSKNVITVAYSYIGPEMTAPIYRDGTIGNAKKHLEATAHKIDTELKNNLSGKAFVSVNKALVTQASSAIPVVPLYMSLLYKVMKNKNLHEGCIEQIGRLFIDRLYSDDNSIKVDSDNRIRIDDWELQEDVQNEVASLWPDVNTENLEKISDIKGYREEFYKLFGFNIADVDYDAEVEIDVKISSIK